MVNKIDPFHIDWIFFERIRTHTHKSNLLAMIGTCDESEKFDSDRGTGSGSWLLVLYSACTVITCIQRRGQCKVDLSDVEGLSNSPSL